MRQVHHTLGEGHVQIQRLRATQVKNGQVHYSVSLPRGFNRVCQTRKGLRVSCLNLYLPHFFPLWGFHHPKTREEGAMNVGPPAPSPCRGVPAAAGAGWSAARIPGWPGLGAARGGGSRRRRSCCNAPFSVPQSRTLRGRACKEVSRTLDQNQLTFF